MLDMSTLSRHSAVDSADDQKDLTTTRAHVGRQGGDHSVAAVEGYCGALYKAEEAMLDLLEKSVVIRPPRKEDINAFFGKSLTGRH